MNPVQTRSAGHNASRPLTEAMQGAAVFFGLFAGSSVIDPGDRRPTAHFRRLGDRLRRGAGQPSGSYRGQRGADRLERGWRGSRLISSSTANNSNAGLARLTK